jgi:Uma2 family endonuclease
MYSMETTTSGASLSSGGGAHAELRLPAEKRQGMGMPDTARTWTREMVLALPDNGNRYELFDGELLVTPAPTGPHQVTLQLSQPDLFVLPYLPPGLDWAALPDSVLTVEVLSPSRERADRIVKRRRFKQRGIPEYWIVDLVGRAVERCGRRTNVPKC